MAFDWTEEDSADALRIPVAQDVQVQITKIVFGNKSGPFRTSASSGCAPRLMLIMADADGREVASMVTLSEKAGWTLRSILSAAGADMQKMKDDGVRPEDFAQEQFANANLIGRRLSIRVKEYIGDDGNLGEIVALRARPGAQLAPSPAAPAVQESPPIDDSDIPF